MNGQRQTFLRNFGAFIFLCLCMVVLQLIYPQIGLLRWENIKLILNQAAVLGLVALGLSIVMISGEIDLSFAGTIGLAGAAFVFLIEREFSILLAILSGISVTLIFGWIAGSLVASKYKFSSFAVTVSLMFITMGILRWFTNGLTINITNQTVLSFNSLSIFGFPAAAMIMLIIYAIFYVIMERSKLGFQISVVGESVSAAEEVGINVRKVKTIAFVLGGLLYGVGSIIEPLNVSSAIVDSGKFFLLPAMAAAFLGTSMFRSGKVNVLGTLFSSVFLNLIINFLTLVGLTFYMTPLIQGLILLIAVGLTVGKNRQIRQDKI